MSYIDHINLIDGINISPIPLEAGNSMTTTKWLMAIQDKLNKLVDSLNNITNTDDIRNDIKKIQQMIKDGSIIKDGSLSLNKFDTDSLHQLYEKIEEMVHYSSNLVFFTISDEGYFNAIIPETINGLEFDTNENGNLLVKY